jgi:purine-binding chemotaxis protein CheW
MNNHSNDSAGNEVLVFTLGNQEYGLDILKVQEIRGHEPVTRMLGAPDYIKGVVNLRGAIVPIVDMRLRMKLEHATYDKQTVVIVLNLGQRVVGMVVDSVSDVMTLAVDQIRRAPTFGGATGSTTEYLTGLASLDDRMLILVDIEKLMAADDLELSERLAA